MINYLQKICPELLKVVTLKKDSDLIDCVIYATDYFKLKKQMTQYKIPFYEYPFMYAFGAKLTQKQIINCAKVNTVSFITRQTRVSAQIDISKKVLGVNEFYNRKIYGSGVTVAVIDTGVNQHLDFVMPKNRIIKFVDLINNKKTPYDDNGHGTFVSSILCGNGLVSGKKYAGVAPKSKLIMIKALEENGETGAFKILEAMQWIYDNKDKYNIKVVCMSFGSNPLGKNDPLIMGAEALWNIGIVVVVAGGNSGPEHQTIKSPGGSAKVITVGGLNDNRDEKGEIDFSKFDIAKFSSRGPAGNFYKPDIVAPAVNITGACLDENNFYTKMSGTSVATPMVAGICCLILSKYPFLTPDQLKIRLLRNCKKITFDRNKEGYGLANFSKFFV